MDELIRKYVLQNAIKFNGKANSGAVIGKLISEKPELKSDMKSLSAQINKVIADVSKMSVEEQTVELKKTAPELLEEKKKEHKEDLKELDNVDKEKGVIMRFAPSPSGPMHIGHAITGGITSLYVKKYGGKFILRIEDTNSDNIAVEAYDMLPAEAEWLFGNVTEVWIQSDRMSVYYSYCKKLISLSVSYVCTCSQEEFKKHADNTEDCPCRNNSVEENNNRWEAMFDKETGYKEGEAVLRFKTSMQDKNPAMRDFPLARINDSEHPRQGLKYRVWPLMNLCVTVDDIEAGMTHIIRAKDHMDNAKRQEKMYEALGLRNKIPKSYFVGRYNFEGLEISCSKTKERIKQGEFSGWDDIRVPFLAALKRRGYQPEAFLKYTRLTGLSQVDKTVSAEEFFKTLNAFNKEVIDPKARRLFFISKPTKIRISHAPEIYSELDLHPDNEKGGRRFKTKEEFLIEETDYEQLKEDEICRLMDCLNFEKKDDELVYHSKDYEAYKEANGKRIIHWLPVEDDKTVKTEILLPDDTSVIGLSEEHVEKIKPGEVVQFERFGFCRLDRIEGDRFIFWYAHR